MKWVSRIVALAGVSVVAWCCLTAWPAIVHGNPAYAILLGATLAGSILIGLRSLARRRRSTGWRRLFGILLVLVAVGWLGIIVWLRPFSALEPALAAMSSDASVTVVESPGTIVMTPTGETSTTGVFFQPGAKVDARAYAAVLRPLAEAGFTVVIPKQPLGIAFLATGAFASAQAANPQVTEWVVGGHSLGGTVAAMDAESHDTDATSPVVGLMLYASYPASDMSASLTSKVLSVSGTEDGLATPGKIEASKADLPPESQFVAIDGAVHAFFGDYGPQPGDGSPAISHDDARTQIGEQSVAFVSSMAPGGS
jgi:pimeloyl-ACP methyl ester carboxylesterase